MSMGARIKQLRVSQKLTQQQLAAKTGIAQNTISDLERGKSSTMTAETLQALCRELVTTPDYILRGVENESQFEAALQEVELVAIFRALPEPAQAALIDAARLLRRAIPAPRAPRPCQPTAGPKAANQPTKPA